MSGFSYPPCLRRSHYRVLSELLDAGRLTQTADNREALGCLVRSGYAAISGDAFVPTPGTASGLRDYWRRELEQVTRLEQVAALGRAWTVAAPGDERALTYGWLEDRLEPTSTGDERRVVRITDSGLVKIRKLPHPLAKDEP